MDWIPFTFCLLESDKLLHTARVWGNPFLELNNFVKQLWVGAEEGIWKEEDLHPSICSAERAILVGRQR